MLNSICLVGRLTADPRLTVTPQGRSVCSMRVAVERRPGRNGAHRGAAFFEVEAWAGLAATCAEHLSRGRLISVCGRLEQAEWTSEDGSRREKVYVRADSVDFLNRPGRHSHADANGSAACRR